MHSKKRLSYALYALTLIFIAYLLLTWMYFKDNAVQLTAFRLLLWFIIIPISLFGFILTLRWFRDKSDSKENKTELITNEKAELSSLETYRLFIKASISLPEGNSWSEIIDNKNDLTVLSEDLSDFDGLPILIKPIERVITEQNPLYLSQNKNVFANDYFEIEADNYEIYDETYNDDDEEDRAQSTDTLTLRLCALIDEQLRLSDELLSLLAQHFSYLEQDKDEPNSAIHVHPDWQPHYLLGANSSNHNSNHSSDMDDEESRKDLPAPALPKLSIYLCIPNLADADFLIRFIRQQLADYGIADSSFEVSIILADDDSHQPLDFIDEHLITLAKATTPVACMLITVDSQINEAWVESSLYETALDNTIPTEAGTLLFFSNKAAQEALNLENNNSILLTKVPNDTLNSLDNTTDADSDSLEATPLERDIRQHYAKNLQKIKHLLLNGTSTIALIDKPKMQSIERQNLEPIADGSTIKAITSKNNINALTDINPLEQAYNLSAFMTFIDSLIEKDVLVNEHHLGHYMPSNLWLKTYVSLSLLVSQDELDKQESVLSFLITKHKNNCMLWLKYFSEAA